MCPLSVLCSDRHRRNDLQSLQKRESKIQFYSEDGVWAEVDLSQNLATGHMKNNLSELFLRKLVSSAGYIMTTYNAQ